MLKLFLCLLLKKIISLEYRFFFFFVSVHVQLILCILSFCILKERQQRHVFNYWSSLMNWRIESWIYLNVKNWIGNHYFRAPLLSLEIFLKSCHIFFAFLSLYVKNINILFATAQAIASVHVLGFCYFFALTFYKRVADWVEGISYFLFLSNWKCDILITKQILIFCNYFFFI